MIMMYFTLTYNVISILDKISITTTYIVVDGLDGKPNKTYLLKARRTPC